MYKQTLCVTLPMSAAVIIAAALFANAGDLNPDPGPIQPTMHNLQEIYDLVQQSSPCGGCTWEYWSGSISSGAEITITAGSGLVHGIWLKGGDDGSAQSEAGVRVCNGPCSGEGNRIVSLQSGGVGSGYFSTNNFYQLDVSFDNGINLKGFYANTSNVTVLYRSTNP